MCTPYTTIFLIIAPYFHRHKFTSRRSVVLRCGSF